MDIATMIAQLEAQIAYLDTQRAATQQEIASKFSQPLSADCEEYWLLSDHIDHIDDAQDGISQAITALRNLQPVAKTNIS